MTPNGDTNGLYVAMRTPTGFVVRETRGGRSTLSFDYRIVAHQYGGTGLRLPHDTERSDALGAGGARHSGTPSTAALHRLETDAARTRRVGAPPAVDMPATASFSHR